MWAAGVGGKVTGNWMFDDADIGFDMSVLSIDCSMRERYETDRKSTLPNRRSVLEALDEYNCLLRSAHAIAEREGKDTNWEAFTNRLKAALKKHHKTWLYYAPSMQAQGMAAGTGETAQQAQPEGQQPGAEGMRP